VTGSDEEFEDFLKRRKPVFRADDGMFEPPAELDRVILRQAREAIETAPPLRVFRGPRWAAPIALAATLVLAIGVVFQAGMPEKRKASPQVIVTTVAQRMDTQEAAAPMAAAPAESANQSASADFTASDAVIVELTPPNLARARVPAPAEAERFAASPPAAAPAIVAEASGQPAGQIRLGGNSLEAPAKAVKSPAWRRDSRTWLAEIERLRNAGDTARANAELEEYKRLHRAYAVSPDQ
jgi:hypothetical protein